MKEHKQNLFTINSLSEELGFDRRTLKKRLKNVAPVKVEGRSRYYSLSQVLSVLQPKASPEISKQDHFMKPYLVGMGSLGEALFEAIETRQKMLFWMQNEATPAQLDELEAAGVGKKLGKLFKIIDESCDPILESVSLLQNIDEKLNITGWFEGTSKN